MFRFSLFSVLFIVTHRYNELYFVYCGCFDQFWYVCVGLHLDESLGPRSKCPVVYVGHAATASLFHGLDLRALLTLCI